MGEYFDVDLDVLQRFVTALRDSTSLLAGALDAMRDAGTFQIGSYALDHAADDFQHTWRYGLGKLKDKTSDAADRTQGSHDDYDQVETGLVEAFDKLAGLTG